jgi:hypothetical protein
MKAARKYPTIGSCGIDHASKLFKVMVLKTNETIPYSSVFIELDCKYWSGENEILLRDKLANKH